MIRPYRLRMFVPHYGKRLQLKLSGSAYSSIQAFLYREGGVVAALVATLQLTYPLSSWCSLPLFPTYAVKGLGRV
jgi:hypothetical protein